MDWVLAQTIDRKRRQLEAEEMEYAERLAKARQKEEIMRKAARGRVRKKLVWYSYCHIFVGINDTLLIESQCKLEAIWRC